MSRHSEEWSRGARWFPAQPYVFTKCERVWNDEREISGSLSATPSQGTGGKSAPLKRDVIDLYQIHCRTRRGHRGRLGYDARLKEEGKVRWIGVSNFNAAHMERAQRIAPITSLQPPYNLLTRGVEDRFCLRAEERHRLIVYSPMKSGLLTAP